MKTVVVVCEGAADLPVDVLDQRTPLQVARCPAAARLAAAGACGLLLPAQKPDGRRHEVLLALLCGADRHEAPRMLRGPFDAMALDGGMEGFPYAYAGNFVTMDGVAMTEGCVSRMGLEETAALAAAVQAGLDPEAIRIKPLGPARVVALVRAPEQHIDSGLPPGLAEGLPEAPVPTGRKGEIIRQVIEVSGRVLSAMPINDVRIDLGENPASHLWLWGGGRLPSAVRLFQGDAIRAGVLSNAPFAEGFARFHGMTRLALRDPWPADAAGPAFEVEAVKKALQSLDFLVVYVRSPQDLGGYGSITDKVWALERFDHAVLGPLAGLLAEAGPGRLILLGDGLARSTLPAGEPGPLVLYGEGIEADAVRHWDEAACAGGALRAVAVEEIFSYIAGGQTWH